LRGSFFVESETPLSHLAENSNLLLGLKFINADAASFELSKMEFEQRLITLKTSWRDRNWFIFVAC
jgi:hypothetical protein